MEQGKVMGLYIAPEAKILPHAVEEVTAVSGRGLEGDRYFLQIGTFSQTPGTGRHVTLIAIEDLEAAQREHGLVLSAAEARRNIVTRGVDMNALIGKDFRVGEVVLRGMRLSEPCKHLADVTGQDVFTGLLHRAGLRADIISGGMIRVGDEIKEIALEHA